ncbi:glutamate transport system permease protein [Streptomyces sp. SAI-208]|uniref:amino acid ABC transporter permease n=1 Tax=unclassified Streptomyces TaxID=2593676 RepID=UPI002475463E|nr:MULTISPECIES: amino acid ABC transporter permease [unclassified Streptomyces]MDH6516042.1 glutamate transport system permease protein [Streptomyces sp. SAI-090]MDH6567348.1 glutamate transport system permease protein [Streptomyces sp. SAI-117]MDH6587719.1 glutamate transport system permease protein [Streptomyces sp. SAI-133]MDH6606870.1 glutamate transport system permease protein [Streptomyces sp. SAI-208]MDH6619872.1 glutamate transport system permease protein [Streptomyces sp. SAI-135]
MSSVLYDTPGPRAKRRNVLLSVVFTLLLLLVLWWVWQKMDDKNQLEWNLWEPFTTGAAWTTYLLPGLGNTLKAAAISMVIALPLGAVFGIARMSDHAWVRGAAGTVVEFFRAIPVLLLMLFANEFYVRSTDISSEQRPLYAVITGLVLYNASVLAEVVRAGILSLPKGQTEAAYAVGLRKGQTMTNILLPQAVTAMLPAIVSQLVVIVKDTALGGVMLGFPELLNSRQTLAANYANVIPSFIVVAIVYIVLNFLLTSFASWLEQRLRRSKKSTGAVLGEDTVEVNPAAVRGTYGTGENTGGGGF